MGHQIEPTTIPQGGRFRLTLIWQALRPPREEYAIFVHVTKDGRRVFGQDHLPLNGAAPTSQWEPGEMVRDGDQIRIPPDLAPGRYQINVGVWDPKTGAQLRIWHGWLPTREKSLPLGEITVLPAKTGG